MTTDTYQAETREHLLAKARELAPMLVAAGDEIDEARTLPPRIVAAMKEAGVFRMSMPREWGGWEADPATQVAVIEEISAANGSAGWCLMIGVSAGFLSAQLDPSVAKAMYPRPDMINANAFVPNGKAVRVEGGYRVTGRWPFASGIRHADWISGPALIVGDDGEPLKDDKDRPMARIFFAPPEDVEIIDNWHTTGLKGTGSCDFAYDDLFVPEERCVDHVFGKFYREGPLYGSFVIALLNHLGVPLGLGRTAIETFTSGMGAKQGKFGFAPKDDATVQGALGEATALVAASRAYAYEAIARVWADRLADQPISPEARVAFRLANTWVHDACSRAIDRLHHAAGSLSVYGPNPLDRCWRDISVARQHGVMTLRTYPQAGRFFLTGETPIAW